MPKIKTVNKLPKCSFCDQDAIYDAPTLHGSWGYMCKDCVEVWSNKERVKIGFKFQVRGPKPDNGIKTAMDAIELLDLNSESGLEHAIFDADREVQCPACKEIMTMEMDASGIIECHGCKQKLKLTALI